MNKKYLIFLNRYFLFTNKLPSSSNRPKGDNFDWIKGVKSEFAYFNVKKMIFFYKLMIWTAGAWKVNNKSCIINVQKIEAKETNINAGIPSKN